MPPATVHDIHNHHHFRFPIHNNLPKHFALHSPKSPCDSPPELFTDSSSGSSSASAAFSEQSLSRHDDSRPSTSSGQLNAGMKALLSPQSHQPPHRLNFFPIPPQQEQQLPPAPQWPVVIQLEEAPQEELDLPKNDSDTYDTRMERIQSWRRSSSFSGTKRPTHSISQQRKASFDEPPSKRPKPPRAQSQFRCTACDTSYASRQGLKRHAQGARTHAACRTAVQYFLE